MVEKATGITSLSLLDTSGKRVIEWYVVYFARTPFFFWTEWLQQGFRHAELWRPYQAGPGLNDQIWLRLKPTFEVLESFIDLDTTPPWLRFSDATVQRVQVLSTPYKVREWFSFGPPSCVETIKNALGIKAFFLRTPRQLYEYINRRGGVIEA